MSRRTCHACLWTFDTRREYVYHLWLHVKQVLGWF